MRKQIVQFLGSFGPLWKYTPFEPLEVNLSKMMRSKNGE